MSRPAYLLAVLLTRYQRGQVDQGQAAKLLGIRKADFADMVAFRVLEGAVWNYYLSRFNHAFPDCDRRAVMRPANLSPKPKRTYTDAELLAAPVRELRSGLA